MSDSNEKNAAKTIFSVIVLMVVLAVAIYGAPRLKDFIASFKSSRISGQTAEADELVETKVKAAPQCPDELRSWIPLVERQLPKDGELKYRLVHMRLSNDGSRLLLDLETTDENESFRFDLILQRDEFGRYVSHHNKVPIKLYPPELPMEKKPSGVSE